MWSCACGCTRDRVAQASDRSCFRPSIFLCGHVPTLTPIANALLRVNLLLGFMLTMVFCFFHVLSTDWMTDWYLWSPYGIGQTIIFLPYGFFFLSLFFSSPNLSGRRLDVCHTSTHGVALVRISDAGLKRAARGSLKIQDAKKFSPKIAVREPSHNFVGLYLRK